ncbi:lipocalin-like domain-containing protein [Salegentibacter salegens]|uniref:Lipocalin-like domain-containing protein n=1 Tax=Salegentibacter salegens TaxID=143223 RepID=A0A1M7NWX9_9FLAO|nr:lipocalin family protein [Salegentibacter salegens]PRX39749.1 lipocalin-like protein [Salegentibacter salegens]SHN08547.1 Lipocalin-like domain-containing protein [Salegentibacter salegens]
MKKQILLFAFLSFGLFTACDSDDDSPEEPQQINENLVGTWYIDAMIVEGEEIPYNDHEDCGKDYVEFNEDGTYRQVDIWGCEEDVDAEGTYTANENSISLTLTDSEMVVLDIVTLNSETLLVEGMEDFDEDGEEEVVQQRFTRE